MRIVCPACEATYDVPAAMLAGGPRAVRCARCGGEWTPAADTPPPTPLPVTMAPQPHDAAAEIVAEAPPPDTGAAAATPVGEPHGRAEPRLNPLRPRSADPRPLPPVDIPPPPLPPAGGRSVAIAAWVLSVLVLVGAGGAAVTWRTQVMAAWPPSQRVYSAVGLR